MVKFLAQRHLLFLVDFSPASLDSVVDYSAVDVHHLVATLKQCPSYQIDGNHSNCGLRTRMLPILEYILTMLSSGVVAIARPAWRDSRAATTWIPAPRTKKGKVDARPWVSGAEDGDHEGDSLTFRFTRSLATDQRLRYEGAMAADRMAKQLFTAAAWDWTPEY